MHQLEDAADNDPLTNAANRRAFYRAAEEELKRQKRYGGQFSVAYFDVDHFKFINDAYGHNAGDELLRRIV